MNPKSEYEDLENCNNDTEQDEYLNKIYEDNLPKIHLITTTIQITQTTGMISFLLFLILLSVRVNATGISFSWIFVHIPSFVCVISFTIMLNMYLNLKDIIDDAERKEENGVQIGSVLSYFCLNLVAVNVIVYLICLSLKMDHVISSGWCMIALPIYIIHGVFYIYFIFIFPAFLQNKMYVEVTFICLYIVSSLAFTLLICIKLDQFSSYTWGNAFIPAYLVLGLNAIYSLVYFFLSKGNYFYHSTVFLAIIFTIISGILTQLKADQVTGANYQNYLPVLFVIIAYNIFISEKVYSAIFGDSDDEKSDE